jgi:hypothetical protein
VSGLVIGNVEFVVEGKMERDGCYPPRVAESGIVGLDDLVCPLGVGGW